MYTFCKNKRQFIYNQLIELGYNKETVESALWEMVHVSDDDKIHKNPKRTQAKLNKILSTKSIFTHILKESLASTLDEIKEGKSWRIVKKNTEIYKEACQKYYNLAITLINTPNN